jgi:hypothetical protein
MQVTGQLPAMDAAQPDHFLTIQLLSASIAAMLSVREKMSIDAR